MFCPGKPGACHVVHVVHGSMRTQECEADRAELFPQFPLFSALLLVFSGGRCVLQVSPGAGLSARPTGLPAERLLLSHNKGLPPTPDTRWIMGVLICRWPWRFRLGGRVVKDQCSVGPVA